MKKYSVVAIVCAAVLCALFGAAFPARAVDKPLQVVASFSILGDMVRQIGGDAVQVHVVAGPNADMHVFQAAPRDVQALAAADIIVINGLGFDQRLQNAIKASGTHARLLVASAGIKPRLLGEGESAVADPHAWQDLANARIYVRNIASALVSSAPERGAEIQSRAARYDAELAGLDQSLRKQFLEIPKEKRKVVTNHDAFGYFGVAYGVAFFAPLGMSTEAQPSARDVAALIEQIKAERIPAVFIENLTDPRLMDQIAKDSGARLGGELFSDALSLPGGPAATYLDLFRHNAQEILKAIK